MEGDFSERWLFENAIRRSQVAPVLRAFLYGTGDVWERNMSFSVCPRTRVVPYGWHRFWLMHAYFIYVQIANVIPDFYNNLDKWDIYVGSSLGAYIYLQQGSPVLRIPQRVYFIGISHCISGILFFYLVVAWYMHSKHVKHSFVDKK